MLRFLTIRILQAIPVLFVMSVITFVIIQAPPGDYGDFIRSNLITQGNAPIATANEAAEKYREEHGLNDPMIVQYGRWIWGIVSRGDFGRSMFYNKPVSCSLCRDRVILRRPGPGGHCDHRLRGNLRADRG
jgi:peptide/nickel transport system permease protein